MREEKALFRSEGRLKILLVRFSAIGDCVLAGYVAQSIRDAFPDAELHWMVEDRCAEIVEMMKIASVHAVPRKEWRAKGDVQTLLPQYRWLSRFKRIGFDLAIDLQGHSKTGWATRLSGAKRRISSRCTDEVGKWLNPQFVGFQKSHEVDWNLLVAQSVLPGIQPCLTHPLSRQFAHRSEPGLVSICTGAGHSLKVIPIETIRRASELLIKAGYTVNLVGGLNDPSFETTGVVNLVGKTSLTELVEIVRRSEVHIAGDTGSGHIAAAIGTPLVSVWGNMPLERYRPRTDRVELILSGVKQVQPQEIIEACWRVRN
jgi:ADP-heptose:LPS heptosyltransferase